MNAVAWDITRTFFKMVKHFNVDIFYIVKIKGKYTGSEVYRRPTYCTYKKMITMTLKSVYEALVKR